MLSRDDGEGNCRATGYSRRGQDRWYAQGAKTPWRGKGRAGARDSMRAQGGTDSRRPTMRGFQAVSAPVSAPLGLTAGGAGLPRPARRAPTRRWGTLTASGLVHLSVLAAAVLLRVWYVPPEPASEGSPFQLVFAAPTPPPPPVPAPPTPMPQAAVAPPPTVQALATPDVPQVAPPAPATPAAAPDIPVPPVPLPTPAVPQLAEVHIPKPEPSRRSPAPPRHTPPPRRVAVAHAAPSTQAPASPTAAETPAPIVQATAQAAPVVPARPLSGMASDAPPVYPDSARRRGEQGRVLLRVNVSAEGRPVEVAVAQTSGFPALDQAAQDAVRRWRFVPASQAGVPIAAVADVRIRFRLEE